MKTKAEVDSFLSLTVTKIDNMNEQRELHAQQGNWNVVNAIKADIVKLNARKALLTWVLDDEVIDLPKL